MKYAEEAIALSCDGDAMVGILARPEKPAAVGVVVIVGGPQYRAGSHRQFVLLSRVLAAQAYPVLRFDYRGMGDSEGTLRDFESVSRDVGAAVDALQRRCPEVREIVLWGLCDGASAGLIYIHETKDLRIAGLCLLNPWVRSAASLARTHVKHYYLQRLMQKEFWLKLARGKVAADAAKGLVRNLSSLWPGQQRAVGKDSPLTYQQKMAQSWNEFAGSILLVLSGNDYTAKEFLEYCAGDRAWTDAFKHPKLTQTTILAADHTFSDAASSMEVGRLTQIWLAGLVAHNPSTPLMANR